MRRIDAFYLYQVGHLIHPISQIRAKYWEGQANFVTKKGALYELRSAAEALTQLIHGSVFRLKVSRTSAGVLLRSLSDVIALCEKAEENDPLDFMDMTSARSALTDFEAVFKAELGGMGIFLVAPKNAMDTMTLIESGEEAFPPSLSAKVPEALADVRQAMSCIAFELATASAFHLHRANEAVLKAYWNSQAGGRTLAPNSTMGAIVAEMDKHQIGKAEIRSSLRDIIKLHRNPTIHPEQSLKDVEEAISLYGAIRAVIGFMLKEIPDKP